MDWTVPSLPFRSLTTVKPHCEIRSLASPNFTRKVLRHVVFGHKLAPGSRVLDAGCGYGELLHCLTALGMDAIGFDDIGAMPAKPIDAEITYGRASEEVPSHRCLFDLAIVRDLPEYRTSLVSPEAIAATRNIMQCVRAGGPVVLLHPFSTEKDYGRIGHNPSCLQAHLATLQLDATSSVIYAESHVGLALRRVFGAVGQSGYCATTLTVAEGDFFSTPSIVSNRQAMTKTCCNWADEVQSVLGKKAAA